MSLKEFRQNRYVRFGVAALLYILWVIWLGNYWWLLGLAVLFDYFVTKKVNWLPWKKEYKEGEKRNAFLDWLDAIIYAVVLVTFLNIFFFQAFKIPSSSMESSLYTGDHLFVEKLTYGPAVPQTPLTIPFTHNQIMGKKSYSTLIHNDYRRLKGFREIKNGDIVVFGFPNGDSVLVKATSEDYYTLVRMYGKDMVENRLGPVITRPSDKKDHYVKRCVAIAGDILEVKEGLVYVNSVKQTVFPGVQLSYEVKTEGQRLNSKFIEKLGLNLGELYFDPNLPGYPAMPLTAEMLEKVSVQPGVASVRPNLDPQEDPLYLFPYVETGWTRDSYGPIWVPEKGATVKLTAETLPFYRRIITAYEGNELKVENDGTILINGMAADEYTFQQNYYFMMGDNRHNSLDSRYWGFVPEDHVVGTPIMVWLSTDRDRTFPKNIRWGRFFKFVRNTCNN